MKVSNLRPLIPSCVIHIPEIDLLDFSSFFPNIVYCVYSMLSFDIYTHIKSSSSKQTSEWKTHVLVAIDFSRLDVNTNVGDACFMMIFFFM